MIYTPVFYIRYTLRPAVLVRLTVNWTKGERNSALRADDIRPYGGIGRFHHLFTAPRRAGSCCHPEAPQATKDPPVGCVCLWAADRGGRTQLLAFELAASDSPRLFSFPCGQKKTGGEKENSLRLAVEFGGLRNQNTMYYALVFYIRWALCSWFHCVKAPSSNTTPRSA